MNVAAVVEERQGLRATSGNFPGWGGVQTEDYRLGRMAIDLVDARRRRMAWHGTAEGRVSPDMLRDAGAAVEMAVAAIFEGFTVQATSAAAAARAPKAY